MKKITKSRLRDACLDLWSLLARTHDRFMCMKCYYNNLEKGISVLEARRKATKKVDAHHIFTKGMHHSIELDLDNAMPLCFAHHKWIHSVAIPEKEREDFIIWFLGKEKYDKLILKSKQLVKTNMDFYVQNFIRLYDTAVAENLEPWKIVPRYIVKELYKEGKNE